MAVASKAPSSKPKASSTSTTPKTGTSAGAPVKTRSSTGSSPSSSSSGTWTTVTKADGTQEMAKIVNGTTYVNGQPIKGNPAYEGAQVVTAGGVYTISNGQGVLNGGSPVITPPMQLPGMPYGYQPMTPMLFSGDQLSALYNIKADSAEYEKLMKAALETEYAQLDREYGRMEDTFQDSVAASADALLGTIRKSKVDAIQAGAAKGMEAANELSALLGTAQANAPGLTALGQGRADLVTKKAADMAGVPMAAIEKANATNTEIGRIAASILNASMVGYGSELANDSAIKSAIAQAKAMVDSAKLNKEAQTYAADKAATSALAAASKYGSGGSSGSYGASASQAMTDRETALYLLNALGDVSKLPLWAQKILGYSTTAGGGGTSAGFWNDLALAEQRGSKDYTKLAANRAGIETNESIYDFFKKLGVFNSPGTGANLKP